MPVMARLGQLSKWPQPTPVPPLVHPSQNVRSMIEADMVECL